MASRSSRRPTSSTGHLRGIALLAAAGATGLGLFGGVAAASTASERPQAVSRSVTFSSLESAAKKAVEASGGVHLVLVAKEKSEKSSESVVGDIGKVSGREVLTYGKARADVLLTPTSAYFSGNSSGLSTFFGLSSSVVKKIGSKWVSLGKSTSQYPGFKSQESLSGLITSIFPPKGATSLRLGHRTSGGATLDVLSWTATASGSSTKVHDELLLPSRGKPLPLSESGKATDNSSTAELTFTKWGEHVVVSPPPHAEAYSKVSG